MKKFFVALACAAFLCGCAPATTYQCRGGASGATEWHTVESGSAESARKDGEFAECVAAVTETVVGVEYAAARPQRRCAAMEVVHAKWVTTPKWPWAETIEVFRGSGKTATDATADVFGAVMAWHTAFPATLKSDETMTFAPNNFVQNIVERCWYGDDVPKDVLAWPAEGTYTIGVHQYTGIVWRQFTPNATVYAPQKCQEWSTITDSLAWAAKDGVARMRCKYELQAYSLHASSDGVLERGAKIFPVREMPNMCGPKTAAQSAMEKLMIEEIPLQYPSVHEFHLIGYAGTCWKKSEPKPPQPSEWVGQLGSW